MTKQLNFMAKEYDNSLTHWNVCNRPKFLIFIEEHYGIHFTLDKYNNFIGVTVTNPNKKLLLDIKCPA